VDLEYFHDGAHLAADFVNTKGWHSGREYLGGVDEVRAFLAGHGHSPAVKKSDIPKLHALRDRLRAVFTAADDDDARRHINALLADFPTCPRLVGDGERGVAFRPTGNDPVSWIGANAAIGLAFFVAERGSGRLGICGASDCDDAFVDESKNSTKHCCSAKCTRLENVRAFRARRASSSGAQTRKR
jgi:predicted RNA-binding Zn ribbon-like protein